MEPLSIGRLTALNTEAASDELLDTFEAYEADVALQYSDDKVSGDPALLSAFFASYQITLMLCGELEEARFLTHRSPPTLQKADQTLINSKNLLRAVYNHEHTLVYSVITRSTWPELLQPLVIRYLDHFREETFKIISSLYTSISPDDAARYLGYSFTSNGAETSNIGTEVSTQQKMIELLAQRGWKWDSVKGLLYPKPVSDEIVRRQDGLKAADYSHDMSRLVGLVGFLAG